MKNIDYLIPVAYLMAIALILIYAKKLIDDGRNIIGDDPLGAVGGDTVESAGWLTRYLLWVSGNPEVGFYGMEDDSFWDWDPLGGSFGWFGDI